MNTNSQTKITPQGLQMTCLGIPSENGCFFVTIFLGPQGPKRKLWQRLLNTDWFYLHASPSIVTLFQLLSSHPLGLLFQKHAQSTLWKAQVNSMRLPLLQGVHWEHKPFAQGTMNGFSGVKDNLFSFLSCRYRTTSWP